MEINKPIASVIILIINLVLIFLFIVPKYQESNELQISSARKQIEYNGQFDYYTKLLGVLKNIQEKKDLLEKVDSALPSNFSFGTIVYFLQKKADKDGLTIKSMTFLQPQPVTSQQVLTEVSDKELKSVNFTVNLSGTYQSLKDFLASLERSARLFEVNTIFFARGEGESLSEEPQLLGQSQTYNFKLEIETYTY